MISFLKSKLKLAVSLLVSLVLLSSPIIAKAAPNNFGMPPGFDWKAERERELRIFDECSKKLRSKSNGSNSSDNVKLGNFALGEYRPYKTFSPDIHKGYALVTKDGSSKGSSSSFIGHAGLVYKSDSTVESSPHEGGVYIGKSEDWVGLDSNGQRKKRTLYILECLYTSDPSPAADYAYSQIGKPYNWNFFDRETTDSFYCSQLVWRSYLDGCNINLCPGAWNFVSPSDILYSDRLNIMYWHEYEY